MLAQLSWQLLEQDAAIPVTKTTSTRTQANTAGNDFQKRMMQMQQANLFGKTVIAAAKLDTSNAPDTTLNLVLRGVLASQPMSLATAIISPGKNGDELSYGIGDSVPGNATIEAIHPDHVILMRNGKLETLRLPENSIGDDQLQPVSSPGQLDINQTPDKVLGDIRRDILKNPTSFGEYAIPVPVSKNGKLQGYRLRPQKKGEELFSQFGLERNDIITQVNGVSLSDPAQALSALRNLTEATEISMVVLRNGAEMPLQFSIR
jgi:general secretion pathway protein C